MIYRWLNKEKTLLVEQSDDGLSGRVLEKGAQDFDAMASRGNIDPFMLPDPVEAIAAWRAGAVASQAQIRLALYQLGLLADVQAIADADPAASIVWEYADSIRRASPFIDALKGEKFTDAQIDDIFRYAMGLEFE